MRLWVLAIAVLASGCASTEITGYTDPAYASAAYRSAAVHAPNVGLAQAAKLEQGVCDEFTARGVTCTPFQSLLPPTREHSADTVFQTLQDRGIESVVVLLQGGDFSSARNFGYQSFGMASINDSRVMGQSTSIGMTAFSRQASMRVLLIDGSTRETAWLGDATTEGQGLVNTTASAFNSSLAGEVVDTLMRSAHFGSRGE